MTDRDDALATLEAHSIEILETHESSAIIESPYVDSSSMSVGPERVTLTLCAVRKYLGY